MPHGAPDDSDVVRQGTIVQTTSLEELAARLGSPAFFDRRGYVLLVTDFSEGLGSFEDTSTAGEGSIGLYAGHSRSGAYSIGLIAGNAVKKEARFTMRLPIPAKSKLGLEVSFSIAYATGFIYFGLYWADPVDSYWVRVRYDNQNHKSQYLNSGATFSDIPGAGRLQRNDQPVHTLKLVVDLTTGEYVRVVIDDNEYSLAGVSVYPTGAPDQSQLIIEVIHDPADTSLPVVYIDNVILTQNEP